MRIRAGRLVAAASWARPSQRSTLASVQMPTLAVPFNSSAELSADTVVIIAHSRLSVRGTPRHYQLPTPKKEYLGLPQAKLAPHSHVIGTATT